MRVFSSRVFSSVLLALALTACGDDTTSPAAATAVGTWSLESINGNRLPLTNEDGTQLVSQVVTFDQGGTLTMTIQNRMTANGQIVTETGTGTWRITGTNVSVNLDDEPGETPGVLNGNTLTFTGEDPDVTYVFRRQ